MSRKLTLSSKPPVTKPVALGQYARRCGMSRYVNPYRRTDYRWVEWEAGWLSNIMQNRYRSNRSNRKRR